jgi:DNA-binding MurR/RpiR family transcriptional regulator
LSPIENVWGYVQREVNKAGCKTFPEFKTKVEQTFKNLSQRHLTRLFASMKDRINQCLALKGAKTRY